ncbi:MAG: hypothetical protein ACAI25_05900 [Planctomycetota bacterium]
MNSREMLMAGATGAVVVCALGWTFVVRPTMERWSLAKGKRDTLLEQVDKAKALLKREGELKAERQRIDRVLGADAVPVSVGLTPQSGTAVFAFLERLHDLTKSAGFAPRELKFVRAEALDAYAELRFELKARAPIQKVVDFLVRMTASESYLRVHAIQMQPKEGGEVEADLSLVGLVSQDALDESERPKEPKGRRP